MTVAPEDYEAQAKKVDEWVGLKLRIEALERRLAQNVLTTGTLANGTIDTPAGTVIVKDCVGYLPP